MTASKSNRDDPKKVEYYQDLADIIGIFWEFHKERIQSGNIEFAMFQDYGDNGTKKSVIPFDPEYYIKRYRRLGDNVSTHEIITQFSDSVRDTMQGSWQQFLAGLGAPYNSNAMDDFEVPEEQKRFFDPYTQELIDKVNLGAKKYSSENLSDDTLVSGVVDAGMDTGATATVHLAALFGEDFKPGMAVLISKVKLDNVGATMREFGKPPRFKGETPEYTILDNSLLGINKKRLRELGLGFTLGCPASMRISSETHEFLISKGVTPYRKTMLEDFAAIIPERFDHYVGEWYSSLTDQQRQTFIDPEQNRVLSGEARAVALGTVPHCPYGKEK